MLPKPACFTAPSYDAAGSAIDFLGLRNGAPDGIRRGQVFRTDPLRTTNAIPSAIVDTNINTSDDGSSTEKL